jgi:hypothetical protein
MNTRLVLALAFALACGGNSAAPEGDVADSTSGAETAAPANVFVLAPLTLTDSRGAMIRVDATGRLSMDGQDGPSPVFAANGDISVDGETVATLSSDGVLRTAAGQEMAVIGLDGSAAVGSLTLHFGADGTLMGGNPDGPGITLAPTDSPAKRLAMSVIIMMLTVSSTSSGDIQ